MRQLTLLGHTDAVITLCLSAKSELIISSGSDNSIRVWDVATGACVKIIWTKVARLPGLFLYNTKPLILIFEYKVPATCLDISSDANIIVGNQFNDVCIWTTVPEESLWHAGQKARKAKATGSRPAESPVILFANCIVIIGCNCRPNVSRCCRPASVILQTFYPAKSGA
jgi:hypothetical protein